MYDDNGDKFRETMNIIIRGYNEAWAYFNGIPDVDNILDEISNLAEEEVIAICYEEQADNPAFYPVRNEECTDENDGDYYDTESRDSIIDGYIETYRQTGYSELAEGIEFLLGELKLTYYGYRPDGRRVLINPAQNILFDFSCLEVFYYE